MNEPCDCCEGIEALTPESRANRPGLDALLYRIGRHATFLETMKAKLSRPLLRGLRTRAASDPSIAMLDAWATVADVLTFYQERIANEGYLRTATERRSVLELARLVGYQLRPGVAASVYLAFMMDNGSVGEIPIGTRTQSLPGPGELPQPFETSEKITARADWNTLTLRSTRPQLIQQDVVEAKGFLYFQGTNVGLQVNAPLLIDYGVAVRQPTPPSTTSVLYRVISVKVEQAANRTKIWFERWDEEAPMTPEMWLDNTRLAAQNYPNQFNLLPDEDLLAPFDDFTKGYAAISELETRLTDFNNRYNAVANSSSSLPTSLNELKAITELKNDLQWLNDRNTELRQAQQPDDIDRLSNQIKAKINDLKPLLDQVERLVSQETEQEIENFKGGLEAVPFKDNTVETLNKLVGELDKQAQQRAADIEADIRDLVSALQALASDLSAETQRMIQNLVGHLQNEAPHLTDETVSLLEDQLLGSLDKERTAFEQEIDEDRAVAVKALIPQLQIIQLFAERLEINDDPHFLQWMAQSARQVQAMKNSSAAKIVLKVGLAAADQKGNESSIPDFDKYLIPALKRISSALVPLAQPPSLQPRNRIDQTLEQGQLLRGASDAVVKLVSALSDGLEKDRLYEALEGTPSPALSAATIYAFRVKAPLFGHNSLKATDFDVPPPKNPDDWKDWPVNDADNDPKTLWLDSVYNKIIPTTPILILSPTFDGNDKTGEHPVIAASVDTISEIQEMSRSDYKMTGKLTRISVANDWFTPGDPTLFPLIRDTTVYAQAEPLVLAEMPVLNALSSEKIELNTVADGLTAGRWVIVAGERRDVGNARGVQGAELAMLSKVEHLQDYNLPGDRAVTYLSFDKPLKFRFKQETLQVYGNVVHATHGETRTEILGSGDGSQAFQSFKLQQKPVTHVAAVTPRGADSTLKTWVNNLQWHETNDLTESGRADHVYVTQADNNDNMTLIFGDGDYGSRLPTGVENVRVQYRVGIGKPGNVDAGKITLLATRPLGVKSVLNPLEASGGADRETGDQARKNAPLQTRALGRIVSVEDYADFARTYAGIGKAQAARLINGTQPLVYLTIAGAEDIPIETTSDLYQNFIQSLARYGDPSQAVKVVVRELLALVIGARIQIQPDYEWDSVKPQITARLLDKFSFERRDLAQDVTRSEVISTIQRVPGVAYLVLDKLDALSQSQLDDLTNTTSNGTADANSPKVLARIVAQPGHMPPYGRLPRTPQPAQIAYLRPDLPETLVLNRITS